MERNIPRPGEFYKHFKDKLYQIITVATHTQTEELIVIYQALYGDFGTYARPLEEFMSEVDRVKYPEVIQQYRFERIDLKPLFQESKPEEINLSGVLNTQEVLRAHEVLSTPEVPVSKVDSETNNDYELKEEGAVNSVLLDFLDAESYSKKLEVLIINKKHLDDRLINDMAVALDCAVNEGPIENRIQELINCLEAMRRFEDRRLR
ncbi:MAG: hypothetical protein K0R00_400 [Herbinix sp.]|jgi:hypothetical protein|nr:hypothetical protein [Herbinix sp.]